MRKMRATFGSFWLILQNEKLICVIGTIQSYLGFWGEIEFRYYRCWNSTKSMREKKKKVERENVEFRQRWYRISSAQFCCQCVECPKWKGKKKLTNELWHCYCRNRGIKKKISNCGNGIAENGRKKNKIK